MENKNFDGKLTENNPSNVNRREFVSRFGKTALAAAAVGTIVPFIDPKASVLGQRGENSFYQKRAAACLQFRVNTAQANFQPIPPLFNRPNNGDEEIYPNKIGSYSKGLPHQSNGEVVLSAYDAFLNAINTGTPNNFEQIPMGGDRKLTNPQSGLAFDLEGKDIFSFIQPPPPAFASREEAAEIAENYWMALLRDVPFSEYETNDIANAAAADLNLFGADYKGAKENGQVTPRVLFRGLTPGDKAGPYMSQFFYHPCFFGANEVSQKTVTVLGAAAADRII